MVFPSPSQRPSQSAIFPLRVAGRVASDRVAP